MHIQTEEALRMEREGRKRECVNEKARGRLFITKWLKLMIKSTINVDKKKH